MIIPSKTTSPPSSLLGLGATILDCVEDRDTVSSLWDKVRARQGFRSFDVFVLALDLLFLLGLVELADGIVRKGAPC